MLYVFTVLTPKGVEGFQAIEGGPYEAEDDRAGWGMAQAIVREWWRTTRPALLEANDQVPEQVMLVLYESIDQPMPCIVGPIPTVLNEIPAMPPRAVVSAWHTLDWPFPSRWSPTMTTDRMTMLPPVQAVEVYEADGPIFYCTDFECMANAPEGYDLMRLDSVAREAEGLTCEACGRGLNTAPPTIGEKLPDHTTGEDGTWCTCCGAQLARKVDGVWQNGEHADDCRYINDEEDPWTVLWCAECGCCVWVPAWGDVEALMDWQQAHDCPGCGGSEPLLRYPYYEAAPLPRGWTEAPERVAEPPERDDDTEEVTWDLEEVKCRLCGCTDARACEGGCWWVQDPAHEGALCSACLPRALVEQHGIEDMMAAIEYATGLADHDVSPEPVRARLVADMDECTQPEPAERHGGMQWLHTLTVVPASNLRIDELVLGLHLNEHGCIEAKVSINGEWETLQEALRALDGAFEDLASGCSFDAEDIPESAIAHLAELRAAQEE